MKRRGLLVVLSGPSGAGKGTLRPGLLEAVPELRFLPSATTRAPRAGEVDGVNYYFWDRARFQQAIDEDQLLEWAEYVGNLYGTPRPPVEEALAAGHDVLLEKDMQGALQIRRQYPDGIFLFILPPSVAELRRRLLKRGTENSETQLKRVEKAIRELESLPDYPYEYAVVNDQIETAVDKLRAIILAERCKVSRQPSDWIEVILEER